MRLLIGLCFAVATAAPQTATWGGEHVRMDVTKSGAELEFDCATGTITEAVPEKDGAFTLKGTFTPQRSGPTRDDAPRASGATYSGTITGDTMALRVVLVRNDQEVAQYVLARGSAGNVRKCR
jgi:hypothetical protein